MEARPDETSRPGEPPDGALGRDDRQIDRSDALLAGLNLRDGEDVDIPLHEPTGEKTRKTYDFTKSFHVGLSCHDIQATQGATRSGVYLIHPSNLAQGPWKVYCDLETEGGGWMVFQGYKTIFRSNGHVVKPISKICLRLAVSRKLINMI